MEPVKTLLEQQPLMALFLTIAIGYLVGEINVKGFSLGVGAVPPDIQAAARAGTLKPNDVTSQNPSYASAAGGVISTANDLVTWMQALVGGRVFNADYQHRWLDSLQPEDPSKPHGQQYRVRHRPAALRTERALFPRRRGARLQLVHGLRSRQSGDARSLDQPDRIARREADSQ